VPSDDLNRGFFDRLAQVNERISKLAPEAADVELRRLARQLGLAKGDMPHVFREAARFAQETKQADTARLASTETRPEQAAVSFGRERSRLVREGMDRLNGSLDNRARNRLQAYIHTSGDLRQPANIKSADSK